MSVYQPTFVKYTQAFGVTIVATEKVPNAKLQHATGVLAQYLDNDMDGQYDNGIAPTLAKANAVILMTADQAESDAFFSDD